MKNFIIIILFVSWACSACSEFLSIDIQDKVLDIQAPADSLYAVETSHSFWWEPEADAERYRIQLVTPDFETSPFLLLDSLVKANNLNLTLEEGHYAWRVRIENPGSSSEWQTRSLTIDQTPPEKAQASYPLHGNTLLPEDTGLRWLSSDAALQRRIAPTADSVYLIDSQVNSSRVLASFYVDFEDEKKVDIAQFLPTDSMAASRKYFWKIVSEDPAGNRNDGVVFNFWWP